MRCINESLKLLCCTKVGICLCIVKNIIAMICIMCICWNRITSCKVSVNLLIWCTKPDCINTKILKISFFNLRCKTCKVSTVECCSLIHSRYNITILITSSVIRMVISCVTVYKTVCKQKIHCGIVPRKCICIFSCRNSKRIRCLCLFCACSCHSCFLT